MTDLEAALAEAARLADTGETEAAEEDQAAATAATPGEKAPDSAPAATPEVVPLEAGAAPAAAAAGGGAAKAPTIGQTASQVRNAPPSPARHLGADEEVRPAELQEFSPAPAGMEADSGNIGVLSDVVLPITVELGRVSAKIRELLNTGPGSVIELDRLSSDPVDVLAGGRLIARGEVVVVGKSMGVRITELADGSG